MTAIALTIAGSDSSGGAGIQADLKTFSALGVYGASVITALTAQNTQSVSAIHDVSADFVRAQMNAVLSDLGVKAIKIGMLSQTSVIEAVFDELSGYSEVPIVLDPVMVATSGYSLLKHNAIEALKAFLMKRVDLVTPNLDEAALLTGEAVAQSDAEMEYQAEILLEQGARAVLLKGGHNDGDVALDLFVSDQEKTWLSHRRIKTMNTHGTGCTLSSAIAAQLAKGNELGEAVSAGKAYVSSAIIHADNLAIGKGHGPVHHFHNLWDS